MPTLHALICSAIDQISLDQISQGSVSLQKVPLNDFFVNTELESEQSDSHDLAFGASESQTSLNPKKRRLTGNAVLERQLDQNKEQLERLIQENERLKYDVKSGNDSEVVTMLLQQLERQSEEHKQEREEHKREMEEHKREKEEYKREKEEHKREMDELNGLLRQLLSTQPEGKGKK